MIDEVDRLVTKTRLFQERKKETRKQRKCYNFTVELLREFFTKRMNNKKIHADYALSTSAKVLKFIEDVLCEQNFKQETELFVSGLSSIVDTASMLIMNEVEPIAKELAEIMRSEYGLLQYDPDKELDEFLADMGSQLYDMV